jgi:hypothetical protein
MRSKSYGESLAPLIYGFDLPIVIVRDDREVWEEWARLATGLDRLVDLDAGTGEVYTPHCVMTWREQVAGMDDMGGIDLCAKFPTPIPGPA